MAVSEAERGELTRRAKAIRSGIVDVTGWAGGSHIGGALSQTDILTLLYFKYLNIDPANPEWPDRDRFILSKGHGGVGLAVTLAERGYFDPALLKDFGHSGSPFGMHLDGNKVTGVDASTGSLGHGLSMAVGLALGARVQGKAWRTYCLIGDGECNEGSIWEAAMAASHYRLDSLIGFVDRNRMMIDGATEDVMAIEPLADKWAAFGWHVQTVDGHDFGALAQAIDEAQEHAGSPSVILAQTVKGKGVDFMENDPAWHYGGLNADLIARAKASLGAE
ncbi:MAG: transketolase [Candidatus Hydrogenedentes bacterium]|nr:transketolase [Candidatus Hydrogenedentota bacterium]